MGTHAAPISDDEARVRIALAEDPDLSDFLAALDATVTALDGAGVGYLFMGGIASSCLGRERWTHDIDVFARPREARRALDALGRAGFDTEETFADWLFKATRDGQLVDVIFRTAGDITLDDEMLERAPVTRFMDRELRTVPPEDLVVIKAIVAAEHSPRHWHGALALLASVDLDWAYLMRRARYGIRRVLSLLLFAQSNDLPVPSRVVSELFAQLEGAEP